MEVTGKDIYISREELLSPTMQGLQDRLSLYETIFNQFPIPICVSMDGKRILAANHEMLMFCGISKHQLVGRTFLEILKSLGMTELQSIQGDTKGCKAGFISRKGRNYRVEIIPYCDGGEMALIHNIVDSQEMQELRLSEERFRIALSMVKIGIWEYNFQTKEIHLYNGLSASRSMLGNIITNVPESLVESGVIHPDCAAAFYEMHEKMRKGEKISSSEIKIKNLQGEYWWVKITYHSIYDEAGNPMRAIGTCEDIDKRKFSELIIAKKLESDPLTGLYNRAAVEKHISDLLSTIEGRQTGVFMMLDIDNFKEINDTYGHPFGDKILMGAAEILQNNFRDADIVGRCGGDEFCVFFCGLNVKNRIEQMAIHICEKLRNLYKSEQRELGISWSIGICMCDGTLKTFAQVYEEADKALYKVKRKGRNGYAFFDDDKCI